MKKQLTALAQSIARKKERIKKLEERLQKDRPGYGEDGHYYWTIINALKVEIAEDEKLLEVEREQLINIYSYGWNDGAQMIAPKGLDRYATTFKND